MHTRAGLYLVASWFILAGCGKSASTPSSSSSSSGSPSCESNCQSPPDPVAFGTIILGNPTPSSVTANLMTTASLEVYFEYGAVGDPCTGKTDVVTTTADVPAVLTFGDLQPDTAHHYRARYRSPGGVNFVTGEEKTFHTQRQVGSTFTFMLQADSHRDENSDFDLYRAALVDIRADKPDFYIDLGDTFMTEKFAMTKDEMVARYAEERGYFGMIADTIPLLLVNGNHEAEAG